MWLVSEPNVRWRCCILSQITEWRWRSSFWWNISNDLNSNVQSTEFCWGITSGAWCRLHDWFCHFSDIFSQQMSSIRSCDNGMGADSMGTFRTKLWCCNSSCSESYSVCRRAAASTEVLNWKQKNTPSFDHERLRGRAESHTWLGGQPGRQAPSDTKAKTTQNDVGTYLHSSILKICQIIIISCQALDKNEPVRQMGHDNDKNHTWKNYCGSYSLKIIRFISIIDVFDSFQHRETWVGMKLTEYTFPAVEAYWTERAISARADNLICSALPVLINSTRPSQSFMVPSFDRIISFFIKKHPGSIHSFGLIIEINEVVNQIPRDSSADATNRKSEARRQPVTSQQELITTFARVRNISIAV